MNADVKNPRKRPFDKRSESSNDGIKKGRMPIIVAKCDLCLTILTKDEIETDEHWKQCAILCPKCGDAFKSRCDLEEHQKANHTRAHSLPIERCSVCGENYYNDGDPDTNLARYPLVNPPNRGNNDQLLGFIDGIPKEKKCGRCHLSFLSPSNILVNIVNINPPQNKS